jgi:hypothetical protein
MPDICPTSPIVNDLDALANTVRCAHAAAGNAARNFLEHVLTAGDALIKAQDKLDHGHWIDWLKRKCDLKERTAQRYMQLARGRAALEANPSRVTDLSLTGALKLLGPAKPEKPKKPKLPRSKANLRWFGRHDALGWWQQASLEERQRFIDSIGRHALLQAMPEAWRAKVEAVLVPANPAVRPLLEVH